MPATATDYSISRVRLGSRLPEVGVVLVTLIAGLIAALAPWWVAVGLILGSAVLALTVRDPLFGLLLTLALATQAIPGALIPNIPWVAHRYCLARSPC